MQEPGLSDLISTHEVRNAGAACWRGEGDQCDTNDNDNNNNNNNSNNNNNNNLVWLVIDLALGTLFQRQLHQSVLS